MRKNILFLRWLLEVGCTTENYYVRTETGIDDQNITEEFIIS
jgi:hypothetical protein